ncbi:hypothetical protein NX059_010260 [Plenodomus lindquistii]|nr:hypothetical protein NX059_010260 [Plenodomus lindquistii]
MSTSPISPPSSSFTSLTLESLSSTSESLSASPTLATSFTSSTSADPPPPPPQPTPIHALSILLQRETINSIAKNSWLSFTTPRGQPANGCEPPLLDEQSWDDENDLASPPWLQGTFDLKLYDESCVYT